MRCRLLGRRSVVILTAALALSSCALFVESPSVRIVGVRVTGLTFSGATAEVSLSVTNPNSFALVATGLHYSVEYEDSGSRSESEQVWRTLVEGETLDRLRVAADDSATVRVSVPFRYTDVGRAILSLIETGEVSYRVRGDVVFDAPLGDIRVPFNDTGTLAP